MPAIVLQSSLKPPDKSIPPKLRARIEFSCLPFLVLLQVFAFLLTFKAVSLEATNYHCLQYIAKQGVNSAKILLTIHVTNQCLKSWFEFKEQKAFPDVKYIDIANALIGEKFGILLKRDCERIKSHFRRLASTVK